MLSRSERRAVSAVRRHLPAHTQVPMNPLSARLGYTSGLAGLPPDNRLLPLPYIRVTHLAHGSLPVDQDLRGLRGAGVSLILFGALY